MTWLLPLVVFLAIGSAATFYILKVRLPRDETRAGIAALVGMSWREFIHLVLDALARRGYAREFDRAAPSGDDEYMLAREGTRSLLSCKHGSSYVLGIGAMHDMANAMQLAGADGGLLLTQGQFASDARLAAQGMRIELLDGPALWPELRGLLPTDQREAIVRDARSAARLHVAIGWGLAFVAALAVWLMPMRGTPGTDAGSESAATAQPAQRSARGTTPSARPVPTDDDLAVPEDPDMLLKRRKDVAASISTVPGVARASWSTQSTLLVELSDASTDLKPALCPLLERYPELRTSRMQLQPPPGSDAAVRFVQCMTF